MTGTSPRKVEALTFQPKVTKAKVGIPSSQEGNQDYKTIRLREMAAMWKGTVLEPHTAKLLSMLLQEDGTLTAERRHDCIKGVCYAIGFQGHHICYRGTPLVAKDHGKPFKTFCTWKDGKSPQQQFEEEYPGFAFDWKVQFAEYTKRMSGCIADGKSVNACIQSWNSREVGRIGKVERHLTFVRSALATL